MRIPAQNPGLPATSITVLQTRTTSAVARVSGDGGSSPANQGSRRLNAHGVERPIPPDYTSPPPRGSIINILV